MSTSLEHEEIEELLGAFVLHSVSPDEAQRVEKHLQECYRCRIEVDELLEVAAALGNVTEPPPPALWGRIAEGVSAGSAPREQTSGALVDFPGLLLGDEVADRPAGGQRTGDLRKRRFFSAVNRRGAWLGIAAAAAVVIAILGVNLSNADGRAGQLQAKIAQRGPMVAVDAALDSSGHRIVELHSGEGTQLAELVVRSDGTGYVVSSKLSALPADETYQLWASISGQPISLGLLGDRLTTGAGFSLGSSTDGASRLMITIEPSGGVVTPDRSPVASGAIVTA